MIDQSRRVLVLRTARNQSHGERNSEYFSHRESANQLTDDLSWGGGTLALEFVPREGLVVG